jgi:hypothetical protein
VGRGRWRVYPDIIPIYNEPIAMDKVVEVLASSCGEIIQNTDLVVPLKQGFH